MLTRDDYDSEKYAQGWALTHFFATTEKDFARFGHQMPKWPLDLMVIGIDNNFIPDEQAFIIFLKSQLKGEAGS